MSTATELFGTDASPTYTPLPELKSYYPTRLEYFAGKALQGLVTGRSEKDLKNSAKRSLELAEEMETLLDTAQG